MNRNQRTDSDPSASSESNIFNSTILTTTSQTLVDGDTPSLVVQKTERSPAFPREVSKEHSQQGITCQKASIEILPADVLIQIFDSYRLDPFIHSQLGGRPWKWQNLSHVCRTWRSVLLASPHYLGLQLFFTDGMPIREILSSSPILPIVMQYMGAQGSRPLTLGDQENVIALLEHPTRLREIQLTVATPILEEVTILMQQPFPQLESLLLSTMYGLVLPSEFGGGMHHLRALRLVGFALPAHPQILLSAHDLVTLWLDNIPSFGYAVEPLIVCLPTMTQLKTLRIHFLSPPSRPVSVFPARRTPGFSVFPVLNFIGFRGTSDHLESLLSGISAPLLKQFLIDFFDQRTFDTTQLSRFIRRTEMQQSPAHARIRFSQSDISINITQLTVPGHLLLRILRSRLDRQIQSMTEICDRLSPTLADVEQLEISSSVNFRDGDSITDPIYFRVLRLLRLFRNVKTLCVSKASLPLVSGALAQVPRNQAFVAFPELKEIQTQKNVEYTTALSRLAPFIAARRYYARRPVFVCSSQSDRVYFKGDAIMDVPSLSSRSSDSSLSLSPHLSTNPLHSASSIPSWASRPRVYTPPQPPIIPPVYLNSHLIAPSLNYDMRFHPNQSKLRLSPAALAKRATRPPSSSLPIRVAGLPRTYIVRPDPNVTHENAVVTTHDVLIALHSYLLKVVNAGEYNAMSKARKADISRQFEWRVRNDPDRRGKGLRRVDFLGGCVRAQGLVRAELQNNIWVWNVVVR